MMGNQYSELSGLLARVRNRWRAVAALRAWTLAAAATSLVLALALVTQRFVAPDGFALVALWLVAAAAVLACIGSMIVPLRRAPGDRRIARFIEECCPELEDALVTAIAERGAREPGPMAQAVVGDAVRRTRALDLDRIVSMRALRGVAMRAGAATMVLVILGVFSFGPMARAARVFALYLFPESLVVDVMPGDVKLRAGQSLKIVAKLTGGVPGLVPVLRTEEGGGFRETRMEPDADGFALSFDDVDEGFEYSVTAAGTTTRDYTVTVIRPPRVEQIDLRYEYPKVFDMEPRLEEDGGDIYGPAGTVVRLAVHTDKPVTEGALTLGDGKRVVLTGGERVLQGALTIVDDGSYRVALSDADGLSNPGETEYFIRTLEDRPPDVRIIKPASDRKATPIEEVTIDARADDDFGIAALDLVYAVRGGRETVVPFRRRGSGLTVNGEYTIYLEDLKVAPGDFVTYYARARDVSRGKRSSEARSDIFFLEVTPFEEEFVASQTQGGAGSQDERSIEDLVESQKEIITATWKLDRRARDAGGRSQEDIKTIASAQGELQRRAGSAAAQMRRANDVRRRLPGAGRGGSQAESSDSAMTRAAEAMGRAQQQLEALSTSGALPHEMAALNELLRAQAEVRRREIQRQQQFANGQGMNRQQQDLSSLFDRELAKQQQTNYETPNTGETRPEQRDQKDELDKVRELARRQDALNREQQELEKKRQGMQDEELKRQLERLTREQTELRRQAEELAQKLQQAQQQAQGQQGQQGRQGGQGAQGGQGGQGGQNQASREMQQASEEMQQAANELRRQDTQRAAERSSRALERLRDLEQRMRSAQPDDRRRALGEMQLESRQLADAERRLAAESQRSRGNDADAPRRRASEQDRLAERMERLERSVRQLADGPQGQQAQGQQGQEQRGQGQQSLGQQGQQSQGQRNALGEAARELDRQRLSERMREIARAERQASAQTPSESGGRQSGSQNPRSGESQPGPGQQAPQGQQSPQGQERSSEAQRASAQEGQAIARDLDRLAERLGAANGQGGESDQLSEQLSRIRDLREQLSQLERQLSELKKNGEAQEGEGQQPGERAQNGRGQGPPMGNGDNTPWDGARDLLDNMRRAIEYETPTANEFNPGRSAPGTEAWKQDFTQWDELKVQLAAALERAENNTAARLRSQQATDRLNAGAAQGVPEQYRRLVDQYYRALASQKDKR
ncbi:MAG TPA: hypothetical protein VIX63_12590 [Vicinamibacterales bacterium]